MKMINDIKEARKYCELVNEMGIQDKDGKLTIGAREMWRVFPRVLKALKIAEAALEDKESGFVMIQANQGSSYVIEAMQDAGYDMRVVAEGLLEAGLPLSIFDSFHKSAIKNAPKSKLETLLGNG